MSSRAKFSFLKRNSNDVSVSFYGWSKQFREMNVFCKHKTRAKINLFHWVRLFSENLLCAHYGPQPSLLSPVVVGSPSTWCSFSAALGCTVLSSGGSLDSESPGRYVVPPLLRGKSLSAKSLLDQWSKRASLGIWGVCLGSSLLTLPSPSLLFCFVFSKSHIWHLTLGPNEKPGRQHETHRPWFTHCPTLSWI